MPRQRAPWWLYIFAASFLAFFLVLIYNDFWGPEPAGISVSFDGPAMVLTEVNPQGAAARAGLIAGDGIISLDGQPIRTIVDWMIIRSNLEVGTPHRLEIERGHDRLQLTIVLQQKQPLRNWDTSNQMVFWSLAGSRLFILLLALVIAFNKPRDLVARMGAWFLASLSIGNPELPYGLVAL